MNSSVLNQFIMKDIYKHKKDYTIMAIVVFVASMIAFSFTLFSEVSSSYHLKDYQHNKGSYTYVSHSIIQNEDLYLNGNKVSIDIFPHAHTYVVGRDLQNEIIYAYEGNEDVIGVHLIQGRFPKNKDEIIVKEKYFKLWGYEAKLNENIVISYRTYEQIDSDDIVFKASQHAKVKEYRIVGIIQEECDYSALIKDNNFINAFEPYTYIETNKDDILYSDSVDVDYNSDINTIFDTSMNPYTLTLIEFLSIIVPFSLVYGIILSSFEVKNREYTLLRSIGITKGQLYYVAIIQSVIVSFLPIILSFIIILIFAYINSYDISLLALIWCLFKLVCIVIFSSLLPVFQSQRKSLTGAFENDDHSYIYYRYKKLHKMTPLYLGWRKFIILKKKSVVKIALLSLSVFLSVQVMFTLIVQNQQLSNDYSHTILTHLDRGEYILKEDLGVINDYASAIHIFSYFESGHYEQYLSSADSIFEVYALTPEVKDYFQIHDELDRNELLINGSQKKSYNGTLKDLYRKAEKRYTYYVFVNPDEFYSLTDNNYIQKFILIFDSIDSQRELLTSHANEYLDVLNHHHIGKALIDGIIKDQMNYKMYRDVEDYVLPLKCFLVAMSIIIFIYTFAFEMFKDKENIGTYQLLGLNIKEIITIYMFHLLILIFIGFVLGCSGAYLELIYNYGFIHKLIFYILPIILCLLIIVFVVVISMIPLLYLVKRNAFENKVARD